MSNYASIACWVALALALIGCGSSDDTESEPARARPAQSCADFDGAQWRHITGDRVAHDERYHRERRALARMIVRCRVIARASRRTVARMLGRPPRDQRFGDREGEIWEYYIAPDSLGIDSELLSVGFDERGRVVFVDIVTD